jgi:hypothetical protein
MSEIKVAVTGGAFKKLTEMPDGTHAEVVAAVIVDQNGNPTTAAADRELLPTRYTCKQAFTGAAIGDVIRQTVALDVSGATMTVISVLWENESSGTTISAPPSVSAYLEAIKQGDALTLAQLLSAGLATATNQVTQIGYLADIAQSQGRYAAYATQQVDEATPGTTYIRKAGSDAGDTWLIQRVVESGTDTTITYAGVRNNPTVTTPTAAWTARASLVYGELGGA